MSKRLRRCGLAALSVVTSLTFFGAAPSAHADSSVNVLVRFNSVRFNFLDDGGPSVNYYNSHMSQMYGRYGVSAPGRESWKAIGTWGGGGCYNCNLEKNGWMPTYTVGDAPVFPNGVASYYANFGIPASHYLPAHAGYYFFSEIPVCNNPMMPSDYNTGCWSTMAKYSNTFKISVTPGESIKLSAKFMDDDELSSDDEICSGSWSGSFNQSELNALNKSVDMAGFTGNGSCSVNATLTRVL
ncbi:hypothetical protein ACFYW6_36575 [Streptomyces sp. NPDC002659]|uniref:hypothetical protein n=1 Tax=Streptomyces sp. NPDC002659 TaxID=3364656 RepID=UPI0036CE3A03